MPATRENVVVGDVVPRRRALGGEDEPPGRVIAGLRDPGRAAGVPDDGDGVRRVRSRVEGVRPAGGHLLPGEVPGARCVRIGDHVLDRGDVRPVHCLEFTHARAGVGHHEDLGQGVVEEEAQLVPAGGRRGEDGDRAQAPGGEEGDQRLGPVRGTDGDPVTRPDAQFLEGVGQLCARAAEVGVGVPAAVVGQVHRDAIPAPLPHVPVEQELGEVERVPDGRAGVLEIVRLGVRRDQPAGRHGVVRGVLVRHGRRLQSVDRSVHRLLTGAQRGDLGRARGGVGGSRRDFVDKSRSRWARCGCTGATGSPGGTTSSATSATRR
jgi:hypothetical protein